MSGGQLLLGPLGPFEPDEDTHVLARDDGRWLVSQRAAHASLRLSDANPSGKVTLWAAPGSTIDRELDVAVGRAELFSDGLLVAGVAPGEWLALTPGGAKALLDTFAVLAGGEDVLMIDRSDGLAAFRLSGTASADVLAGLCDVACDDDALPDGSVLTVPLATVRCTIVRDDLLPEEVGDEFGVATDADAPLLRSYLLLCDRSVARSLHGRLLDAGASRGIEAEGFVHYRSYHRDV